MRNKKVHNVIVIFCKCTLINTQSHIYFLFWYRRLSSRKSLAEEMCLVSKSYLGWS